MPKTIPYEWSQTATHLSLLLRMPHLKPKPTQRQPEEQLSVVLTSCFLRVCRHPLLLELDFWDEVAFKAASILPSKGSLSIVVPKSKEGFWGSVAAVSNPQLQPAHIKERRGLALAAYAEWQQQLREQRVAALQARQDQQQKLVWDQQRQQRAWHQQQKDLQVQQVLKQLEDDDEPPLGVADCRPAPVHETTADATADARAIALAAKVGGTPTQEDGKIVFIDDFSDTELGKRQKTNQVTSTRKEPDSPCAPQEAAGDSLLHLEEAENRNWSGSHRQAEASPQSKTDAAARSRGKSCGFRETADAAEAEAQPEQQSFEGLTEIARKDLSTTPVTVPDAAFSLTECKTIKLSFGARRPNRVPARGPRAPPLPHAALASTGRPNSRDKPGDLARLQQSSPQWLQSKALRLLCGGDPAAAADAHTAALQALPQPPHQLSAAKILCGRSLAWLADGNYRKVLADCSEALGMLQEVQMREEAAAAAAGQVTERSSLQVEASRLQQVLLARRAAAFLRLDDIEKAADSLEELQQLQQQHLQLQLQEKDPRVHPCDDSDLAAVTADLQNVRRLLHARQIKEEADAALRVGIKRSQEQQKLLSFQSNPTEHPIEQEEAREEGALQAAAQAKPLPAAPLLHRSISLYVGLLNKYLLPISSPTPVQQEDLISAAASSTINNGLGTEAQSLQKSRSNGATSTALSRDDDSTTFNSEETTENALAGAAEAAERITAGVRAAAAGTESFSCAAAAATVLSNMALALLQLQEEGACSAAQAAAGAANALVELVEKKHKVQQVESKPGSQLGHHSKESEGDPALTDLEEKHAAPVEEEQASLASTVSVLHKSNEQLLARLKQRVSARLSQATRQ
ncbi:hypothetical protein Esti_004918 [Eimeria stiedai]